MNYSMCIDGLQERLKQHLQEKPELCKHFTNTKAGSWLQSLRAISRSDQDCADNMLMREMAEAFSAYQMEDYAKSIECFQTCGAIILRCMNYIYSKTLSDKK